MPPGGIRVTAVLAFVLAGGAGSAEDRVIRYDQDTLTVHVANTPLSDVLDAVASQAGAEVRGQLRTPHDVTAEFENVPLAEALGRLLGDQNFALVYANDGKLRAVKLLGGPAAPPAPGTVAAMAPPTTAPAQPADLATLFTNHPPVPIAGRLAEYAGGPNASLTQLLQVAMHHEDPAIRAEAVRTVVTTLEGDPALRSATVGQLNAMDDRALSSLLRGAAGEYAEEVAMQVLAHSRAAEIRMKASAVLQRLRAGS